MDSGGSVKNWPRRFLGSPAGATLASALGLVTGLLGSLNTQDIVTSFPFTIAFVMGPWAKAFWVCFVVTALLFFSHQRIVDTARERAQQRLEEAHDKLPDLIRTLPPAEFLSALTGVFEKLNVVGPLAGHDKDALLQVVAAALGGVATLAAKYDDAPGEPTYGANIMVYVDGAAARPWEPLVKFAGPASLDKLRGLLVLPIEFSATQSGNRDPALEEFALPVPLDTDIGEARPNGTGWRVLPGAPFAFVRKSFELYVDSGELASWCAIHGDFTKQVQEEMRRYFEAHKTFAGFMSVPLYAPTAEYLARDERVVIAVLNLHWSTCRRFRVPKAAETFADAIGPLRTIIAAHVQTLLRTAGPPKPTLLS